MEEGNVTSTSLEDECDRDRDCLFVAGDGLFKVWHVILIAVAIFMLICKCTWTGVLCTIDIIPPPLSTCGCEVVYVVLVVVIVLRFLRCPRLPEEARKKKELERRLELEESGINLELNNTDGHVVSHVHSPYEGNVDQPLDPPGNVDLPLTPPETQDVNVVYNPSAGHKPPPATCSSRYSHEPSDSVELRYIRSRTTSEVRDSYYHENTGALAESSPNHPQQPNGRNSSNQFPPIMSTSTRI